MPIIRQKMVGTVKIISQIIFCYQKLKNINFKARENRQLLA